MMTMRRLRSWNRQAVFSLACMLGLSSACRTRDWDNGSTPQEFVNRNLVGRDFDLGPGEYVLTFDDGPGEHTEALVNYLITNNTPAVFFLVGTKVKAFPGVVRKIASRPDLFYVANHSMTHTDPLTTSTNFAIREINEADTIIRTITEPPLKFMRPPYGALVGSVARIQGINAFSPALAAYIGPVFWDVGGELTARHSADWACWGQVSIDACQAGYLQEMADRTKGIVLLHDIHPSTVEMVTRRGGLVDKMKERNFKIVNIAPVARRTALAARFNAKTTENENRVDRPVLFAVSTGGIEGGKRVMSFTISSQGATKFEIGFDRSMVKIEKDGPTTSFTFPFANPGSRVVTVTARYADGTFTEASHSFTVAAPVATQPIADSGTAEGTGGLQLGSTPGAASAQMPMPPDVATFSQCFDVSKMTTGRTFDLFTGEGSLSDVKTRSKKVSKSKLTLIESPVAIGPETWLLRYERKDAQGKTENFRVALSTRTGCIVDGVRIRPTAKGLEESFVRGRFIDCANKVWRGDIITPALQSNEAVLAAVDSAAGGTLQEAAGSTEWFTFHADESDNAEPLASGPGTDAGKTCADE